jgi:hypothetical protein
MYINFDYKCAQHRSDKRSIITNFFFSPRKGKTAKLDEYVEAETRGMSEGQCEEVYGSCPISIRKLMPERVVRRAMMKKKK